MCSWLKCSWGQTWRGMLFGVGSSLYTVSMWGDEILWEVTTTIHFPHWWATHTKYGSYDHNPLPPLVVNTHQIWKLRPQHPSFTGSLHTPNMEVTTTALFPHWWSTHTKYGSYDHTSPTGSLHTPNMEEGMTNNDTHTLYLVCNAYIAFTSILSLYTGWLIEYMHSTRASDARVCMCVTPLLARILRLL